MRNGTGKTPGEVITGATASRDRDGESRSSEKTTSHKTHAATVASNATA